MSTLPMILYAWMRDSAVSRVTVIVLSDIIICDNFNLPVMCGVRNTFGILVQAYF